MVKRLASVATAVAIGFGSTVAVFIFMQGTKSVCAKVPALYEQLTNTEGDEPGSEHPSGPVIIDRTGEEDDVGNGRITLWKIGFQVWQTNPLFGVGFQKGIDRAKISGIESPYLNISGGFHNIYVEAFVGGGLIGGLLFLAYWVMASKKAFSFVGKAKQLTAENSIVMVLIATTGAMLFFGMFEYILISPGGFIAVPFWTMLGYLNYFIMDGNQHFPMRKNVIV